METPPSWLMPRKRCGLETDCSALIATVRLPSVPFLKPTAEDRPEAISRWVWDSVVRAPMADQLIRSCRYCGRSGQAPRWRWAGLFGQVAQQLATDMQAVLDLEGVVQVRVVDQAFPADGGARLLEVHAHDQEQGIGHFGSQALEAIGVLVGGLDVVDRAGADHHEQAMILAIEDVAYHFTAVGHGAQGSVGERNLAFQLLRRDQGPLEATLRSSIGKSAIVLVIRSVVRSQVRAASHPGAAGTAFECASGTRNLNALHAGSTMAPRGK